MADIAVLGITAFGQTAGGVPVRKITLAAGALRVAILTWGAVVQSVRLAGVAHDLTLGSDLLADYEGDMCFHGSLIAPVVNRLSGAHAVIGGRDCVFEAVSGDDYCLHSGSSGTHLKVWDIVHTTETELVLALDLPDGEGGFPGNRHIEARFTLHADARLQMQITATTDAPTVFNASNHSYWNLDGTASWDGHSLHVAAESYLATTDTFVPTGEIVPVADSPLDFRTLRKIAPTTPDMDNCFCLSHAQMPLRDVLRLQGQSGVSLVVATTEAGVQLYDGRDAVRPGHAAYEGIAIEAQGWPDAPNHAGFPPIDLIPGQTLCQITEWRFEQG